jgi:hypothetical protein
MDDCDCDCDRELARLAVNQSVSVPGMHHHVNGALGGQRGVIHLPRRGTKNDELTDGS